MRASSHHPCHPRCFESCVFRKSPGVVFSSYRVPSQGRCRNVNCKKDVGFIQPPIPEIILDQDDERYPYDSCKIAFDEDPFGSPTSHPTSSLKDTQPIFGLFPMNTSHEGQNRNGFPFRSEPKKRNRRKAWDGSIEDVSMPYSDEEM